MNVKFTLWDAVEHNERIELLLTKLEDEFKELKQKGYLMNINVQEKLARLGSLIGEKEMDKRITTLLEEQSKQEEKKDKDVELVEQFHFEIELVRTELNNIKDYPFQYEVQIVKLNRIFLKYKDALRITNYDTFVKYYNSNSLRASENIIRAKEQQKEDEKESSRLSLTYKGYRMEIVNTINYEKRLYFTGKCEIMNFDKSSISITSLIEDFEKTVDSVLFMNK